MNKVILIGRLTQNPARYSKKDGTTYCKFSVAINRGEDKADFINCTCFSKQAENIIKYLSKGSLVAVEGRLQTSKYYDDRSQKNITTTDVIVDNVKFLDRKKEQTNEFENLSTNTFYTNDIEISEEDLPFE
ncbi:MAG: single-stranded DNA-binding protein [Bacilli bacterium]|nr:single-stranded DNA-binding protein [Bacilli bacterium]